jgi:hypothetical protein
MAKVVLFVLGDFDGCLGLAILPYSSFLPRDRQTSTGETYLSSIISHRQKSTVKITMILSADDNLFFSLYLTLPTKAE